MYHVLIGHSTLYNYLWRVDIMKVENINKFKYQDELVAVGLKIGYLRRQRGLTQEQLSDRAGISASFLSQVEAPNMAVAISLVTLFAIADALQVPPSKLLEFD